MSKGRRRHTAEPELLRQHVAEKKPVSEVSTRQKSSRTHKGSYWLIGREKELEEKLSRLEAKVALRSSRGDPTLKKKLGEA